MQSYSAYLLLSLIFSGVSLVCLSIYFIGNVTKGGVYAYSLQGDQFYESSSFGYLFLATSASIVTMFLLSIVVLQAYRLSSPKETVRSEDLAEVIEVLRNSGGTWTVEDDESGTFLFEIVHQRDSRPFMLVALDGASSNYADWLDIGKFETQLASMRIQHSDTNHAAARVLSFNGDEVDIFQVVELLLGTATTMKPVRMLKIE